MVEMAMFNVQRAMIPKEGKAVTIHVVCILSHGGLHLCEVW